MPYLILDGTSNSQEFSFGVKISVWMLSLLYSKVKIKSQERLKVEKSFIQ